MAWLDLDTVQFKATNHTIDEMKEIMHKDAEKCYDILKSNIVLLTKRKFLNFRFHLQLLDATFTWEDQPKTPNNDHIIR